MSKDKSEQEQKMVQLELPLDAYRLILDYVHGNLEWDSESEKKQEMYDALNTITRLNPD